MGNVLLYKSTVEIKPNETTTFKYTIQPQTLNISVSNYNPKVGESVKICAYPSISEDVRLDAFVNNKLVATYTILCSQGINCTDIIPSMLGTSIHFKATGKVSGATAEFDINVSTVSYPNKLTLLANGKTSLTITPGEIVEFTVTADNNASCNIKLYAYIGNTKKGEWDVSLTDGSGSISLKPSMIGDNTSWYAICEYNNVKSNIVTVSVGTVLPSKLTLLVNGKTNITVSSGDIVKFDITADNNASCSVNLYALVNNIKKGEWVVSIVNGSGSIRLVPSMIAKNTSWYAICRENSVKSNYVYVTVGTQPTQPVQPIQPTQPAQPSYFEAKCPESVIEVYKVGRCWNWTKTHTYFPFEQLTGTAVWHVDRIDCKLKGGPSELNKRINIQLQVKKDDKWIPVKTFSVMAYRGEPELFSAEVNDNITGVRFVSDIYVDYSAIKVYGTPITSTSLHKVV